MESTKLKPCPFCGGKAVMERLNISSWPFRVVCNNVKCKIKPSTWLRKSAEEAAEYWNRRAE